MKLPLSSIWRDDCAKRLSSRSSGGRLSTPGVHRIRHKSDSVSQQFRAGQLSARPAPVAGTVGARKTVRAGRAAASTSRLIWNASCMAPPQPEHAGGGEGAYG